jgi:hypothetical protein
MKKILENKPHFLSRRIFQIDPKKQVCIAKQRWHKERLQVCTMQLALCREGEGTNHVPARANEPGWT